MGYPQGLPRDPPWRAYPYIDRALRLLPVVLCGSELMIPCQIIHPNPFLPLSFKGIIKASRSKNHRRVLRPTALPCDSKWPSSVGFQTPGYRQSAHWWRWRIALPNPAAVVKPPEKRARFVVVASKQGFQRTVIWSPNICALTVLTFIRPRQVMHFGGRLVESSARTSTS